MKILRIGHIPPADVHSAKWKHLLSFSEFLVGLFVSIVTASCEFLWVSYYFAVQSERHCASMYEEKCIIVCRLHFCRWNPSPAHNQASCVAVSECTASGSVSMSGLELEVMMWAAKQSKIRWEEGSSTLGKSECGQHHIKTGTHMETNSIYTSIQVSLSFKPVASNIIFILCEHNKVMENE
jgi:hypothetical protein